MFMQSGGGEMEVKTQEVQAAVPELEPLKSPTPEEIDQMMDMLGYNALEDSTPENRHERKQAMGREKLYRQFHAAGQRGELFALRGDGDRIIGLLGLRADIDQGIGRVTLLRTATRERPQFNITEKLLIAAEHYFRRAPRGYTHGIIEAAHPSGHLEAAAHHGARSRFWEFAGQDEDDEGERNPLEQAA